MPPFRPARSRPLSTPIHPYSPLSRLLSRLLSRPALSTPLHPSPPLIPPIIPPLPYPPLSPPLSPLAQTGHCVLESMVRDPYANYVVQKVIDVSDERQRAAIMRYVKENITQLRRYKTPTFPPPAWLCLFFPCAAGLLLLLPNASLSPACSLPWSRGVAF